MKRFTFWVAAVVMFSAAAMAQETTAARAPRILIAYFSYTNNTKTMAEEIQRTVGGDLFRIEARNPYPSDHQQTVNRARSELNGNQRPALASTFTQEVMSQYDVIFLGYPNWWHTMPTPVMAFLEQFDLSGKYIAPFCTHEGSGLGGSIRDLGTIAPNSTILQGLQVPGRSVGSARNTVTSWLRTLNLVQ